jgi:LPS-assembly protein
MKKTVLSQFMVTLFGSLTSTLVMASPDADIVRQCYVTPPLPSALASLDSQDQRVVIRSDHASMQQGENARFDGNVSLSYRDTLLSAPRAEFSQADQSLLADGGIEYFTQALRVRSSSLKASLAENELTLTDADYRLLQQAGRGHAKQLIANDAGLTLEKAVFTTCPEQDNGWALQAQRINLNSESGWGEAWNSTIHIKGVPVLYLPYMTFPVNDERKSGLLIPQIGSSQKRGIDMALPYYLNLAENYDATITPRLMTTRGTQLKTEFRYLTSEQQGEFHVEYLNNDRKKPVGQQQRYLTHWTHQADMSDRWRANVDFTDVSDDSYLNELGSDFNSPSDTQLYRQAGLNYFGDWVNSDIRLQGFEILGRYNTPYTALPIVSVSAAQPFTLAGPLELTWTSQYAHFRNDSPSLTSDPTRAHRAHVEPTLRLPYISSAFESVLEGSWLYTRYQFQAPQASANQMVNSDSDTTLARSVPKVRWMNKLHFEREYSWFGEQAIQTLEPQAQYLYIPYRDQQQIPLFDTARLQDDYFGLFRENRFSGLDRINDANQVTLGVTTRFYDQFQTERVRFSIGQILYIESPQTIIDGENTKDIKNISSANESVFAAEALLHFQQRWYLNSGVQYDADSNRLLKSGVTLDYRSDDKALFQLNHRYSRSVSDYTIAQLGALGTMPINETWQMVASYHRDVERDRMLEANLGLQYQSCCWAVRLVARRQIEANLEFNNNGLQQPVKMDTGFALQFVLKGFGDSAGFDVSDMLSNGIFGYRRPYLLNN